MLGSYDIIVKTEEIRRRVQEGDFDSAQKVLDTMVLKKVKNIADLSLLSEVLTKNERYDEAMELLNRVYKKSKTRRTLHQMVFISIGRKNIEDAERFLRKYEEVAPSDYNIYIFRYKIDKLKKESYETLIKSLKELKNRAYIEKWAYELAKMYYKAGMEKECIKECSDIILWFGEGSYVEKARVLKAYYSGEVGKDEIIKKLKNRAYRENKNGESAEESEELSPSESENKLSKDEPEIELLPEDFQADPSSVELIIEQLPVDVGSGEEHIYTTIPDLEVGDRVMEEIADYVSKEVESILSNEQDDLASKEDISNEDIHNEDTHNENRIVGESVLGDDGEVHSTDKTENNNEDLDKLTELSEYFDVDIMDIFGNFLHVESIKNQLVKSIEIITSKRTKSVQMIITGAPSSGKSTLAKDIAIFLNKIGNLKTSRIAKISAMRLNEIDDIKNKEELRSCCMVIENANELKKPTIDKILALIKYFHGDIAIIFEENKKNMNRLFREYPKLMEMFKNRIHLPQYTDKELLGFAKSYIMHKDYKLETSTIELLIDGVDEIINSTSKEKQLESISKYVQNTINFAELRTGKLSSKPTNESKQMDSKILSLLPEDFNLNIIP